MAEEKKRESVKKTSSKKTSKVANNERIADVLKKSEEINKKENEVKVTVKSDIRKTKTNNSSSNPSKKSQSRQSSSKVNSPRDNKENKKIDEAENKAINKSVDKNVNKKTNTKKSSVNTTNNKVPSTRKINKQAKKEDKKIKQILAEQLANIENLEENSGISFEKNSQEAHIKIDKKKKQYDPAEIAQKIENKKKLPKEEKSKLYRKIIINIIVACAMVLYLIFINLGCMHIEGEVFITDLKVFSLTLIAISIIIFESAYSKDDGGFAIFGIETLVVAIITLVSIYIYILHKEKYIIYISVVSLVATVYYILKSIIIGIHGKKEYKKTISDVKEIIEED